MTLVLLLAGLAAAVLAVAWLPHPYLWGYGAALAAFGLAMCWSSRKALWFNLAAPIALLFALEAWSALRPAGLSTEGSRTQGYIAPHAVLGYAPTPGYVAHQRRRHGDQRVYEVDYTIDEHGLRVAPPVAAGGGAECLLFFGGSFTFGEGLGDHETLPYQTGLLTGGRYRVYNFGYHGYGPHQMLAALESGLVDGVVACRPRMAIYQAIHDHASRAAGHKFWDTHGPRYEVAADGTAERRGHFDDGRTPWPAWLRTALLESAFFARVARWHPEAGPEDYARFLAIVESARREVETRYPGCEFHVLLWDKAGREMDEGLRAAEIPVHLVNEILPDRPDDRLRYQIHARERHPNAAAYAGIGRYLKAEILSEDR